MPHFGQKDTSSPFSEKGLIAGKKQAFKVVFCLALVSFLFMTGGIYTSFFKSPVIETVYYLAKTDQNPQQGSLIDPQPPQNKPEIRRQGEEEDSRLIKQLEKERENIEQTAEALREIIQKTPETTETQETAVDSVPQPEDAALQKLYREKDAEDQEQQKKIEALHKERVETEKRKTAVPDAPATSSSPLKTEKPVKKETAAPLKKLQLTKPGQTSVPLFHPKDDLPQPDLVQTNLIASLPDFGLIKKSAKQDAIPLHIIDPLPELQKDSRYGKLPVRSRGKTPLSAYGKTLETPPSPPYIAILFSGLGKRDNTTQAAIATLPDMVSLSFSPYTEKLQTYITNARKAGHETLLDLPMQQGVFPDTDPGPLGLVSGLPEQENRKRLYKVLGKNVAFIGITAAANENFSYSGTQMKPFFEDITQRGLIYVNGTDDPHMPVFPNTLRPDVHIANEFYRAAIRARLEKARKIALEKGNAFVRIEAVPITLLATTEWIKSFAPTEQNPVPEITFVPLSYYVSAKKEKE